MRKITSFLWFNNTAEEAANFYMGLFPDSKIVSELRYSEAGPGVPGSIMTITFELYGQEFTALNGGPEFSFTPATSFFVNRSTVPEVDALYAALSEGGKVLVELGAYPFSERFAWVEDRFGVSWQINRGQPVGTIIPFLMFVGDQFGKAEEAISLYTALFPNSNVNKVQRFDSADAAEGTTFHAAFSLHGQDFMAIDSGYAHEFGFSQAISFFVHCDTQQEVDMFWDTLTDGGEEQPCGWLRDRYGVTWQIVPSGLFELLQEPDPARAQRVTEALYQMKKIDLAALQAAHAYA